MLHNDLAAVAATFHGLLDIQTGFRIFLLFEQDPGIRIQISCILRLSLHRAVAHLFSLVKLAAFHGQEVCIIVQGSDIVRIVDQR